MTLYITRNIQSQGTFKDAYMNTIKFIWESLAIAGLKTMEKSCEIKMTIRKNIRK